MRAFGGATSLNRDGWFVAYRPFKQAWRARSVKVDVVNIAGRPAIRKVAAHKIAQSQRDASQFPSRAKRLTI